MVFINSKYKLLFLHPPKSCGMTVKETLSKLMKNENSPRTARILNNIWDGQLFSRFFYHYSAKDVMREFPNYNDYYTFITVRNPYDRLYSLYGYVLEKCDRYSYAIYGIVLFFSMIILVITLYLPWPVALLIWILIIALLIIRPIVVGNGIPFVRYSLCSFEKSCSILPQLMRTHSSIFGTQWSFCEGLRVDKIIYEDDFTNEFEKLLTYHGLPSTITSVNIGVTGKDKLESIKYTTVKNTSKYRYLDKYNKNTIKIINELYAEDFTNFGFKMILPEDLE